MIFFCFLGTDFSFGEEGSNLKDNSNFNVVPMHEKKEIQKFASWFHQDWQLIFSGFSEGTNQYLDGLTSERRAVLKMELEAFVEQNKGRDNKSMLKEWIDLGAEGWDSDLPLYETLESFAQSL